jgi:hypothetical protein
VRANPATIFVPDASDPSIFTTCELRSPRQSRRELARGSYHRQRSIQFQRSDDDATAHRPNVE